MDSVTYKSGASLTNQDLVSALSLLLEFYEEAKSIEFGVKLNLISVMVTLESLTGKYKDSQPGFIEIAMENQQAIGIIGGFIESNPFDHLQKTAKELFWYVKRQYRDREIGKKLLLDFEEFCKKSGCSLIYMGSLPHLESTAKAVYEKAGYHPIELFWVKEISHGS